MTAAPIASKGLRGNTLGLFASVAIGVASTAPAYSLAATLGLVSQQVQGRSPIILLLAFVPMLFISFAYRALNQVEPDCGTSFTWVTHTLGRYLGWLTGWVIIAADVIVMANLAQVAGIYAFLLVGTDGLATSIGAQAVAGCAWILVMTVLTWLGIELSARTQLVLLSVEMIILAVFAVVALVRVYSGHALARLTPVSWSWFNPAAGGFDISTFSIGLLLAVFIYWGWDSAVSVNEETTSSRITPGLAAVVSTLVLLTTYVIVSVAAQAYIGVGDTGLGLSNPEHQDDILSDLGHVVLGGVGTKLLLLAVLTSAAASTQTTILPTARTALSMAVHGAAPVTFGRVHRRYQTPTVSTWAMGLASIVFYVCLAEWAPAALDDLIACLGLLIAFYYGLTGIASAVYFWRGAFSSLRSFLERLLLPLLGGLILLGAFVKSAVTYADPGYGTTSWRGVGGVFVFGIGSILLGVLLMLIWNLRAPTYFRRPPNGRS
jgi:amino acid transporter